MKLYTLLLTRRPESPEREGPSGTPREDMARVISQVLAGEPDVDHVTVRLREADLEVAVFLRGTDPIRTLSTIQSVRHKLAGHGSLADWYLVPDPAFRLG